MFSLCFTTFVFFLKFSISHLKPDSKPRPKLGGADDLQLEGNEAKFQRDLSRGFGERGILLHL